MDALVWALTELSAASGNEFMDWLVRDKKKRDEAAAEPIVGAALQAGLAPGVITVNGPQDDHGNAISGIVTTAVPENRPFKFEDPHNVLSRPHRFH
jgi:hypothetical protein